MKSCYSFEDRGTDRQTESILECTFKDLSNDDCYDTPIKAEN